MMVRINISLSDELLKFVDEKIEKLSTEDDTANRSKFIRKVLKQIKEQEECKNVN